MSADWMATMLQQAERSVLSSPDLALPMVSYGRIQEALGVLLRVSGLRAGIGELCRVFDDAGHELMAEVTGFARDELLLTPLGPMDGISSGAHVEALGHSLRISVGDELLGRIVDGLGVPIDGLGALGRAGLVSVERAAPSPLSRPPIETPFPTGVRSIDALLTMGEGQRVGLFAPAGVGKSSLLAMLARGCAADVIVLALTGERGREVREFIERDLGPSAMKRCVVVVATSDRPAMERLKCAFVATAIAEYFRDRGRRTLLLVDSLTRLARAQREIGLAAGEPPTRRGYPPSLFSMLPRLLERAGTAGSGSITAVYTVLMEDDETADPVAEEVRSLLDGHIVLSRDMAGSGRYPAIDVLQSLSRLAHRLVGSGHAAAAARTRQLLAKYNDIRMLLQMGEFERGHDADADEAVDKHAALSKFMLQPLSDVAPFASTLERLLNVAAQRGSR